MAVLLSVENVSKSFPGVKALQDVSFDVDAGTIHAVMGENGAGKSTLMLCIAGVQRPDDGGRLVFEGQPLQLASTRDANDKGIAIVFQELNLAPNLSIAENIVLGQEPRAGRVFVDRAAMAEQARQVMRRLGMNLDPGTRLGSLTIAQQQLVEIAKSLVHQPRLLILDEPTSSLSEAETLVLFRVIADLKREGVTMLYISHRMREVFALCDAVTVLRDG
jgi:ribose transport system ATP-binding protein/rhamnose transport system ATP-binding protein